MSAKQFIVSKKQVYSMIFHRSPSILIQLHKSKLTTIP